MPTKSVSEAVGYLGFPDTSVGLLRLRKLCLFDPERGCPFAMLGEGWERDTRMQGTLAIREQS